MCKWKGVYLSFAEALLVEHFAEALVGVADRDVPVVGVGACVAGGTDRTQRWHDCRLVPTPTHWPSGCLSMGQSRLLHYGRLLHSGATLQLLKLVEHVVPVVARLAHALVKVIERRMGHLERLVGDGSDATQVGLVTLVLENGLLAQLNPVLFLQFLDQSLQELLLRLHLFHLGLHFERYAFLHAPLVHLVATDLGKELHVSDRAEQETTLVEVVTELGRSFLLARILRVLLPRAEQFPHFVSIAPLINPSEDNLFITISLHIKPEGNMKPRILIFDYLPEPPCGALSASYLCKWHSILSARSPLTL